jgi:hypothetical protein
VWPSCQLTSYSFLRGWPLDAVTVERLSVRHDFLLEAAEATVAMLSAAESRCSDCPVDPTSMMCLHTFLQPQNMIKIQATLKKLGNKRSDPKKFIHCIHGTWLVDGTHQNSILIDHKLVFKLYCPLAQCATSWAQYIQTVSCCREYSKTYTFSISNLLGEMFSDSASELVNNDICFMCQFSLL